MVKGCTLVPGRCQTSESQAAELCTCGSSTWQGCLGPHIQAPTASSCGQCLDMPSQVVCGAQGVTLQLTQGVVKNIIPAIASTNAVVAAVCTLEALKLITTCSHGMQNYMMCACCGRCQTWAAHHGPACAFVAVHGCCAFTTCHGAVCRPRTTQREASVGQLGL